MSFQKDINPNAPCSTFKALLSLVQSSCPKQTQDAGGPWKVSNCTYTTRNSKECINVSYSTATTGGSNIYVYFVAGLIGWLDYPELLDLGNLLYPQIASTELGAVNANAGWVAVGLQKWSYPVSTANISIYARDTYCWAVSATIYPAPAYAINPGIKGFNVTYPVAYTDKDSNVSSGPASNVNSTDITVDYQKTEPGQNTNFQNDFNAAMGGLNANLGPAQDGASIATSLDKQVASMQAMADTLGQIRDALGPIPNAVIAMNAVAAAANNLVTAANNAPQNAATALNTALAGGVGGALVTKLDGIEQNAATIAGASTTLFPNAIEDAGEKVKGSVLALKASHDIELPNIAAAAGAIAPAVSAGASTVAAATTAAGSTIAGAEAAGAAAIVHATEEVAAATTAGLGEVATATAAAGEMTVVESQVLTPIVEAAAAAAGETLPMVTGVALSPAATGIIISIALYETVKFIKDLTDIAKTIYDVLHTPKIDITGDAKAILSKIRDCICQGLNGDNGPWLELILQAIGDPTATGDQPPPETIRAYLKKLNEIRDALYLANDTTPAETSFAELVAGMKITVRDFKGNVTATFP